MSEEASNGGKKIDESEIPDTDPSKNSVVASTDPKIPELFENLAARRQEATKEKEDELPPESVTLVASQLKSDNQNEILAAVTELRRSLAGSNPPRAQVVREGFIRPLVPYLFKDYPAQLQAEVCWVLTNVCSGTNPIHTACVIVTGVVPQLVKLLDIEGLHIDVKGHALWCLGNIAGEGEIFRDYVTDCGIIEPLLKMMKIHLNQILLLRRLAWTMSNLCRGTKPHVRVETMTKLTPMLTHLLVNHDDNEVMSDVCWAISYILHHHEEARNPTRKIFIAQPCLRRLVVLMSHELMDIHTAALRAVGNVICGTEEETNAAIEAGALEILYKILFHQNKKSRKEALWSISNICCGSVASIQKVIDTRIGGLMAKVMKFLYDQDLKEDATYTVCNFLKSGKGEQILYLKSLGVMNHLCSESILGCGKESLCDVAMCGIINFFRHGLAMEKEEEFKRCINIERIKKIGEKGGGTIKLKSLERRIEWILKAVKGEPSDIDVTSMTGII